MIDFYLGYAIGIASSIILYWTFHNEIGRAMPKRKAIVPKDTWKIVTSEINGDSVTHRISEI